MPNQEMQAWLTKLGISPELLAKAATVVTGGPAPGAPAADPWGDAPKTAASSAPAQTGELPQPMRPDCKTVLGKVPGPKNHVLCAKHGHILDTDAKTIIAHDLRDYKARQFVGKVADAAAPVVQGLAKAAAGIPIVGSAVAAAAPKAPAAPAAAPAAPEPTPKEPKLPPEERAYRINAGKTIVATKGLGFVTTGCTELVNNLIKWKAGWEQKIKELSGEATESGGIFAKIFGIVAGAVAVIAPELEIAEKTVQAIEALEKSADITEAVADHVDEESKKNVERIKASVLDQLQKLCDTVSDEVSKLLRSAEAAIKQKLDGLDKDAAVAAALVNGEDSGITFIIEQKLKIKSPENAHHATAKMMADLETQMEKFLRDTVVKDAVDRKTAWMDQNPIAKQSLTDEKRKELKEEATKDAREDFDSAEFDYEVKHGELTVVEGKKK